MTKRTKAELEEENEELRTKLEEAADVILGALGHDEDEEDEEDEA